jgi:hypothetical protein
MSGHGFRGGARPDGLGGRGYNGEGAWLDQFGTQLLSTSDLGGGAGGGAEDVGTCGFAMGTPGNGGGSRFGGSGNNVAECSDAGIGLGGDMMSLGGGGGSGGNSATLDVDPLGGAGGHGGGIVVIEADVLTIGSAGVILAEGEAGQGDLDLGCSGVSTSGCWDRSGPGGGGGGGTIYLWVQALQNLGGLSAAGGLGGLGGGADLLGVDAIGGAGGAGRVIEAP